MKKIRHPITFIVLVIAALALPLIASANNQWGRYSWPTSGDLTLTLGHNLTTDWEGFLTTVNGDWNSSTVVNNTLESSNVDVVNCEPAPGAVEICNSDYTNTGWLGIAGIWVAKGKQITRGYVKVNDFYFDAPIGTYSVNYNTTAFRQMVMCQEVGHVFGLAHQDEGFNNANLGTCMDYTNDPEGIDGLGPLSNLSPNTHDYDQLLAMYGSSDDGDKVKGGGKGNGGGKGKPSRAPGADISQWGKAISTDGKGRPDLFELDLGNGNKLFTHVLWAN